MLDKLGGAKMQPSVYKTAALPAELNRQTADLWDFRHETQPAKRATAAIEAGLGWHKSRHNMFTVGSLALALAGCGDSDSKPQVTPGNPMDAAAWTIGPTFGSTNYSINMPASPSPHPEGWSLDFGPDAEPHYIVHWHGSLTGKSRIVFRFRVEAEPGTRIFGAGCANTGTVTPYFQRADDDLTKDGGRWWATFATVTLDRAGDYEIVAPLDGPWTSVMTMTATANPREFAEAKANAGAVGLTFGNCEGYGHGVRATGPVRVVVKAFGVE